jgi:hypothetical protein
MAMLLSGTAVLAAIGFEVPTMPGRGRGIDLGGEKRTAALAAAGSSAATSTSAGTVGIPSPAAANTAAPRAAC